MNTSHRPLVSLALLAGLAASFVAVAPGCGASDEQVGADAGPVAVGPNDGAATVPPGSSDGAVESSTLPDGSSEVPPSSGSRLRRMMVGPAGAADAQFVGFHDTTLDIDCAPVRVGDDFRCLPPIAAGGVGTRRLFTDAACTQEVIAPSALPCGNPHWIVRGSEAEGGDRIAPVVLPALDAAIPLFERSAFAACGPLSTPVAGDRYALGALRPASDYARAAVQTQEADSIRSRVIVSDDGARWPATYVEISSGLACGPWPDRDGTPRCLPGSFGIPLGFADSACLVPQIAAYDANATYNDTVLRLLETGSCPPRAHLLSVAGRGISSLAYNLDPAGVCEQFATYLHGGVLTFLGAGEIEPATLGPFAEITVPASARLTAVVRTRDTDRATSYYVDTQRGGAFCRFATATDGEQRCLPFEPAAPATTLEQATEMAFADAGCTQPIRVTLRTAAALSCSSPNALVTTDSSTCPPTSTVHALGEERSVTDTFYKFGGDRCTPKAQYGTLRVVGEPIAPTEFERGVLVTE